MKKLAAAGVIAAIFVLFTPSSATPDEGCVLTVGGLRVCGELLEPLPTVTVNPDPIIIPGPTITIKPNPLPGPTVTIPPPPPETVVIPGPTETVTVKPEPVGPSEVPSQPSETVTETETVTPSPTGQTSDGSGTVEPSPEPEVETETETRTKTETIVRNVLLGTLVSLALAALGILAMFVGYILGQRDAKKNEDKFLGSLLDATKIRKRS